MFLRRPILQTEVNVQNPDPMFAEKLLDQFGGATGELTAALTYWTQSFHTADAGIRDMLQDIGAEEFTHLEVNAMLIEQHTKNATQTAQENAYESTLFSIRGPGPHLVDSKGLLGRALRQRRRPCGARFAGQCRRRGGSARNLRGAAQAHRRRGLAQGAASPRHARSRAHADVHGGAEVDQQAANIAGF